MVCIDAFVTKMRLLVAMLACAATLAVAFCAGCLLTAMHPSAAWADLPSTQAQLAAVSSVSTQGAETVTAHGFEAVVKKDGTLEITGYTGKAKRIVFPSKIEGREVTSIGGVSPYPAQATSVVIPSTVRRLNYFADSMGYESAFAAWLYPNLKSIEVAQGNRWLSSVDGVLFNKEKTELLAYPASKAGKGYAIPNGVKAIGKAAFRGAKCPTRVTIPASVRKLDWNCFMSSSLKEVTIPKGVKAIAGKYTFSDCKSLVKINMQAAPKVLPLGFASMCPKLKSVSIPEGVQVLGPAATYGWFDDEGVFGCCTALRSLKLPSTLKRVGPAAFTRCTALKSLTVPDGVRQIDDRAFSGCSQLALKVPASVVKVGIEAFDGVKKVTGPGA